MSIIISILLAYVNLTYSGEAIWFVFPMAGMSFVVMIHYLFGVRHANTFMA